MPGTSVLSFSESEIRMRFREPYVTRGLNAKLAVVTPAGVYRGFRLGPSVSAMTVTVEADPIASDHVVVYETASGFSMTIRKVGGDFDIDLSSFASKTVALAVYATYSTLAPTVARIKVYELDPTDELTGSADDDEVIVLGTVVVPASGTISASSITHDLRKFAWERQAREAVRWSGVLKNGGFEWGTSGLTDPLAIPSWESVVSAGNGVFSLSTSSPRSGGVRCARLNVSSTPFSASWYQPLGVPVSEDQLVKLRMYQWRAVASTAGSAVLEFKWLDRNGSELTATTKTLAMDNVDTEYVKIEHVVAVPTNAVTLKSVGLAFSGMTYGSTGVVARWDDWQAWVEPVEGSDVANERSLAIESLAKLIVNDFNDTTATPVLIKFDSATPSGEGTFEIQRADQDDTQLPPATRMTGRLFIGENLLSSEADARKARVTAPIVTSEGSYTLLWESLPDGGKGVRAYTTSGIVSDASGLQFVLNASFDGTVWSKDVAGSLAVRLIVSEAMKLQIRAAASNTPWSEGSWVDVFSSDYTGKLSSLINRLALGSGLLSSEADALLPRLSLTKSSASGAERTLILKTEGPTFSYRLYHASDASLSSVPIELTANAVWNGTGWDRDDAVDSVRVVIDNDGVHVMYVPSATSSPWADADWQLKQLAFSGSSRRLSIVDGTLKFSSPTTGSDGSNPPSTVDQSNTLSAAVIPKAWGVINGGSGTPTVLDGAGIASVAMSGNGIRVTLAHAMLNTNYSVTVTPRSSIFVPHVTIVSTTVFDIFGEDGTFSVLNLSSREASVVVFGKHA